MMVEHDLELARREKFAQGYQTLSPELTDDVHDALGLTRDRRRREPTMPNGARDTKVVVIGLDCAEPSLVFDRFADRLPNLTRLRGSGAWGKLRSCDPPITVPAWMSMMSSKDPGTLGYYGFRNRADRSYEKMTTATSLAVQRAAALGSPRRGRQAGRS